MNFEYADIINPELEKHNFSKAIEIAETELKKIKSTDFHYVLNLSLLHHSEELAKWTETICQLASKNIGIGALYFELNEFDINTDRWYIDLFIFENDGGHDPYDMEWLCDFNSSSYNENESDFTISGYEKLQEAFETTDVSDTDTKNARDWSEQLIIARFLELMSAAHQIAKKNNMSWANTPIYFTEHQYDFILRSE